MTREYWRGERTPLRALPAATMARLEQWIGEETLGAWERRRRSIVVDRILDKAEPSDDGLIHVNGDLDLNSQSYLTCLPEGLCVTGSLYLSGCRDLVALPKGLRVGGSLDLHGCTALRSLPDGLRVHGTLSLFNCTHLTELPSELVVGRNLGLDRCTALTALPRDVLVGGSLYLLGCRGLTHLPADLRIGGDIDLRLCTSLQSLPEGLQVGGSMNLLGLSNLRSLSSGLCIGGNLDVCGCTGLTTLPDNLHVGGGLTLTDCVGLLSLPENLYVGGRLDLCGCTGLRALPEGFFVGGNVDLTDCENVTALSSIMLTWAPRIDGEPHIVVLDGSGISRREVSRVTDEARPGSLQFMSTPSIGRYRGTQREFERLDDAVAFWTQLATGQSVPAADLVRWVDGTNDALVLKNYLSALRHTADFSNRGTRVILANRIVDVLEAMSEHADLRDRLIAQMVVALTSCGDRVSLSLSDMEIEQRIAMLEGKGEDNYREFARSLLALEEVRRLADAKARAIRGVDHIEIRLAYEIRVAQALESLTAQDVHARGIRLPVSTRFMLYPDCAREVRRADIERAREAAIAVARNDELLNAYLVAWLPWQRLQRSKQAADLRYYDIAAESEAQLTCEQRASLNEDCPICLCRPEPDDLVFVYSGRTIRIFSFEAFLHHWVQDGTDPVNRQPLALEQLRRLI